jgi:hypothetical protein
MHIAELIKNNRALLSPVTDEQVIEISCALMFLSMMRNWRSYVQDYCSELLNYYHFNFTNHHRYPTIHASYQELIRHPRVRTEEYRTQQTKGSALIPVIMLWATLEGETWSSQRFSRLVRSEMKHCNQQLWMPGPDSEELLYLSKTPHGLALCDIPITADGEAARRTLERERSQEGDYSRLSAVHLGHWPILVMACRHSRLPIPPQLWFPLVTRNEPVTSSRED